MAAEWDREKKDEEVRVTKANYNNFCPCPPSTTSCQKGSHRPGGPLDLKPSKESPNCNPCCDPPDWANHPDLRKVMQEDMRSYRQGRLQRWLDYLTNRLPCEPFGAFIGRAREAAEHELNRNNRHMECVGDEFPHYLDKYVWRMWKGAKLNLSKHGVHHSEAESMLLLELLREECDELFQRKEIDRDPTPMMHPNIRWTHSAY